MAELSLTAQKVSRATGISSGNISGWQHVRTIPPAFVPRLPTNFYKD